MKVDETKYSQTEIPSELNDIIQKAIDDGKYARYNEIKKKITVRTSGAFAACIFLCFVVLVNTSETFAEGISNIPVINKIGEFFCINHEEKQDEYKLLYVTYPELKDIDNEALQKKVNLEISRYVNDIVADYETRAEAYYNAYIATGGEKENYIPYDIVIDYDIKSCNDDYVSFVISATEKSASHYDVLKYYNLDLKEGSVLSIKDVLGTNYVEIIENAVLTESESWDEQRKSLMWEDVDYSEIVNDTSNFYIDELGQVYIVFNKYEIAAGAAGVIEVKVGNVYK